MLLTWARQRDCQMSFIISRGYVEFQILKTSASDPLSFWNILICICRDSEKSKTERTLHIFICKKKVQTHLDIIFLCVTKIRPYYIFVCNESMDKKYLIPYSCVTNVRTLHIYFIIRILNGCKLRIENSVTMVTVQHREACRVMPNSYLEWRTFNLHQTTIMGSFSCILFLRQLHLGLNMYSFINFMHSRHNYIFQWHTFVRVR